MVAKGRTPPARLVVLSTLSVGIGFAGGVIGWAFLRLSALMLSLTLTHKASTRFPTLAGVHPGWGLIPIAAAAGLLVAVLAQWEPMVRGHGIPETMDAVLRQQSRISIQAAIAKPVATAFAIGSGAPFGAEGPIIVTGGALGSLLGQAVRVSPAERKILLAAGSAAGMAAIFGTPVGAVLLAIELLLFEFSTRAFVPLVIASVTADAVHTSLFGRGPFFSVPNVHYGGAGQLPFYAVLGLAVGLLGVVISVVVYRVEDLFERSSVPRLWQPVIGAVIFASVGLAVPRVLGPGYDVIGDVLHNRLALGTLAIVLVAKVLVWWVAIGSGNSGSSLAPLLLMGAAAGSLAGSGLAHLAPGAHLDPAAFALVGMVATFGAAADAPFTSIVLGFELTRNYELILPLMLATVLADLVAKSLMHDSLMTRKLTRRGMHVSTELHADALRSQLVDDVMSRDVETIDTTTTVAEAIARFRQSQHRAFPVVDPAGKCIAILTERDVLLQHAPATAPALSIASRELVIARPDQTVLRALERMVHEDVRQLPVIDADGRLAGLCTRLDVLRVSEAQAEGETAQPGWVRSQLQRSRQRHHRHAAEPSNEDPPGR